MYERLEEVRSILSAVPDYITQCDLEGRIIFINRTVEGVEVDDVIGTMAADWAEPAYREDMVRLLEKVIATGAPGSLETKAAGSDGGVAWYLNRVVPVRKEGKIVGTIIIGTDISLIKRHQQTIRLNEERLRLASDIAELGIWEYDLINNTITRDERDGTLFGLAPPGYEPTFEAFMERVHPEDRPLIQNAFDKTLKGQSSVSTEYRIIGHDFNIYWLTTVAKAFVDESGKPLRMIGVTKNITPQKQVEEQQQKNLEFTRAVVKTTVDGIITINEQGLIQSFNNAAERIFKYQAEEVIGKNVNVLMPSPYHEEHDSYLESYLQTGVNKIIGIGREVIGRRSDGSVFPLELAVSEMNIGERQMFTGIVRDISERRQMELEILQISEYERQNIGQELHDGLGSQLSGLGMICQHLAIQLKKEGHPLADTMSELTDQIKDTDYQARNIARGLVPVAPEPAGLRLALGRMVETANKVYGVECSLIGVEDVEITNPTISTHLYRIAQEALSNAIRHGKSTRVVIRFENLDEGGIILEVKDNGIGIPDVLPEGRGVGLRTMKYRASVIGCQFIIKRCDEGGTVVRCRVHDSTHRTLLGKKNEIKQ